MNAILSPLGKFTPLAWQRLHWSSHKLVVVLAAFFTVLCNQRFWAAALSGPQADLRQALALGLVLLAANTLVLALLVWRWNARVMVPVLLVASALAVHWMNTYNVYLDADMLRNVLHTDRKEAGELLGWSLLPAVFGLALLPGLAVGTIQLTRQSWQAALGQRLLLIALALLTALAGALLDFQNLASLMRNQREIRYLATPVNYLVALPRSLQASNPLVQRALLPVGADAHALSSPATRKPRLLVLVIGETVRAQNWGLNGYHRQTTPELSRAGVINFPDMRSCGSSTEVSLPCMFSPWGRADYDEKAIKGHQSLLHVLDHAGITPLWRDNQSGCKGVCAGLAIDHLDDASDPALCRDGRCMDEILLQQLEQRVRATPGDRVVVLHQLGNHGPAYFQRYPASYNHYQPGCQSTDLGSCSREQITNSYDNAVRYTDHFLATTIARLKALDEYDSAMIYVSDHGESLGEKGLYLHGLPWAIAPDEQTRVPMVMWFSDSFARTRQLDLACLRQRSARPASHDNLFASVLGLMQVATTAYRADQDLFAGCQA
jgi:lipid A ethanolaminephosphotransferase